MADSKIDSGLPVIRGCVFQGTTAEQAGFRVGDRLLSINDHPMADFNDPLRGALRSIKSSVTTKTPFTVCFLFNKKDQPDRVLRRSSNRGRYRGGGRALL